LPLVVFADLGSSNECGDAYDLLRAEDVEVLVIDHHPPDDVIMNKATMINPWLHNMSSDYSAGYIAYLIAKLLGKDFSNIVGASLAGDRSELGYTEEDSKTALALDYVAFYMQHGNPMDLFKDVFYNKEFRDAVYSKAADKVAAAQENLLKLSKRQQVGKFMLYYFDAEVVGEYKEFPPSGKMATILAESVQEPAIILSYTSKMFSFRVSKKGLIDLAVLVENLKKKVPAIESGGGHKMAASIKIREPTMKDMVVAAIIDELSNY
jgi:RecJ-like exonuclease